MNAIQLNGLEGFKSLNLVEVERPTPAANEVLINVKAAGVNYAEIELTRGKYPRSKPLPCIMGFEASGVVVELGSEVKTLKAGDRVTGLTSSGGYAEYATVIADNAIPIPEGLSFAEASTIPIQGLSAYALLKFAAKPLSHESLLIQAAGGGVGLYLVQLAKIMGVNQVVALASSKEKLTLVKSLGANFAIDYSEKTWPEQVREVTGGKGADIILEMASGEIGDKSFNLMAPFGRVIVFGARNYHDAISTEKMQQLIFKNQSIIGFAFPTFRSEQIQECVSGLLPLIAAGKLKLFANTSFPIAEVHAAFQALASRKTIGKVVLIP